jgi:modulator of FtsH protease
MGKFLFVGMIVVLLAAVANIFFQIPALSLTIAAVVVLLFSAYILYDISRIVQGGETNYVRPRWRFISTSTTSSSACCN